MALGTITVQVNAMTSDAYSSFSNTVIQAYYYCSQKLGSDIGIASGTIGTSAVATNDNEGIAVAMLAAALLANGKLHSRPDGIPKTIDELYTEEIEDMLLTPDDTDVSTVLEDVMWDDSPPTENGLP